MWCLNCGRKQPPKAGFCQYCGEQKAMFAPEKPRVPDQIIARNLRLQSMAYYFMVLSGLLLVLLEVAKVAVYAVNIFRMIIDDNNAMESFYQAMAVQQPFAVAFSLVARLVVLLFGASAIVAAVFTKMQKRKIAAFVTGGLTLLWLLLDLFGLFGTGLVPGVTLLALPLVFSFVGHSYLSKTAVGTLVRVVLAMLAMWLVPVLFEALIKMVFGMFGYQDFSGLFAPFFTLAAVTVRAVTQVYALSRLAMFFSQVPDLCRPRRVKRAPAPRKPRS